MTHGPNPLRVLHVINHDQRRGAENVAWSLARGLESPDVTNRLVALGPAPSESPPLGVQRLSDDRDLTIRGLPRRTRNLRQLMTEERPHVVLAHGGQACLHSVLAANVPVVWHRILGLPKLSAPQRALWSFVVRRSAAAIAITDHLEDELAGLGHRGPVLRVPNVRPGAPYRDLDHETQRESLVEEFGVDPAGPILGFVGHLVDQKDPLLALEVFETVGDRLPSASFVFAGDGPLGGTLRAAVARSPMADRVRMLGYRSDVPALLSGFDCLVITSRSESMAGVSVEAALAGCPVVTCDFDGAPDVIVPGESGAIVPSRQANDMADEVIRFVEDSERLDRARVGARNIGEQFELEHHLSAYRAFLAGQAMRSLRVLFLMPDIGVGGAERALAVIARHHNRTAMQMSVATLRPPRRPEEETVLPELGQMGVSVVDIDLVGRADRSLTTLLRAAVRVRRLCRLQKIDIVDSCLFEADLVARFALLGTRTRHVVHLVNTPYATALNEVTQSDRRWRRRVVQQVDRQSSRLTDQFIAITSAVKEAAHRDLGLPDHRVSVISRGVDLAEFAPQPMPRSGDELHLLSIGRLVPQKAHDIAIRGVALAVQRGVRVTLTIYGEGPLHHELTGLIEHLAMTDRVDLAGPVRDVRRAHRHHDAFVFLSRWEGQGNALLEAMACARPVLVTDIPVFREVVGPVGRTVAVDAVDAIADEIGHLAHVGAEARRAEGQACRERVEARYGAQERVHDLEEAYGTIRARRPPRASIGVIPLRRRAT